MLYTINMAESLEFYSLILGFRVESYDEHLGWACIVKDTIRIMFSLPNEQRPFDRPVFTGSFYFYPDNVELLWHKVKDQVQIAYPLEKFDYGMHEFGIYDNNGYLLQFGKPLV